LNSYRDDGRLQGTSLTANAGLQLLAPILVRQNPDREHLTVDGILALESHCPASLSDSDKLESEGRAKLWDSVKELLTSMALLIADYLAAHSYTRHNAAEVTRAELDMALTATAYQVCGPLQAAQSSLDLLRDQVAQEEPLTPVQLRKELDSALKSLEDAVLATENLRLGILERRMHPKPTDLQTLVRRVLELQKANLEMAGVEAELLALTSNSMVLLDARQAEYVLEGVIRGVWQEALRQRRENPVLKGEQRPNKLLLSLEADPSETRTIRLLVRDNGAGWPDDLLQGQYHQRMERYSPKGLADNRGLALWEAERLAEHSNARLTVRNHLAGGAILEVFFPLALTTNG
jgi:hypothetical protein